MFESALYRGRVRHRRTGDVEHRFAYPVWYLWLDLDDLVGLDRRLRLFSHNRFNLTGFDDRDHMGPDPRPVKEKLESWLRHRNVSTKVGKVMLLTHARVLGSVFNPVSFFFVHDRFRRLIHVVAEVNNTFGETYCYLLDAEGSGVRHEENKVFHVSPFQPLGGRYRFRIFAPGSRLTAHIDVLRNGERVFDSALTLERRQLTDSALLQTVLRHPHTALRTLGLIHVQAFRLWLKRAPFFAKPDPPQEAWRTHHG